MDDYGITHLSVPLSIPSAHMLRCDVSHLEDSFLTQRLQALTESKERLQAVPEVPAPTQCTRWCVYAHFSLATQWFLSDF